MYVQFLLAGAVITEISAIWNDISSARMEHQLLSNSEESLLLMDTVVLDYELKYEYASLRIAPDTLYAFLQHPEVTKPQGRRRRSFLGQRFEPKPLGLMEKVEADPRFWSFGLTVKHSPTMLFNVLDGDSVAFAFRHYPISSGFESDYIMMDTSALIVHYKVPFHILYRNPYVREFPDRIAQCFNIPCMNGLAPVLSVLPVGPRSAFSLDSTMVRFYFNNGYSLQRKFGWHSDGQQLIGRTYPFHDLMEELHRDRQDLY